MVIFAWPMMLGFAGVVGAAGVWALWRGTRGVEKVSSTKLWEGLVETAAGGKRRAVDPVWLMVLIAAVLAGVGLAGPGWRSGGEDVPKVKVIWAMRSLRGELPEMFVRVENAEKLATPLSVEYFPDGDAEPWPAGLASVGESIPDPMHGAILHPTMRPEVRKISVRLHSGRDVVAVATFTRPERAPFGLMTQTGKGLGIDGALYRVFSVNPAARVNDATVSPRVLLVNDPKFDLGGVGADTLVVALPETGLPGVKVGGMFKADVAPVVVDMPSFVKLDRVRVMGAREAELTSEWKVAARVEGKAWVATRRFVGGPMVVWLGSMPNTESDWPGDSSFPIYFVDLLEQTFPGKSGAGSGVEDWMVKEVGVQKAGGKVVPLAGWLGAVAIMLLVGASGLLLRRGRR